MCLLPVVFLVGWMALGEQIDHWRLRVPANALYNLPLPPQTELLSRSALVLGQTSFCEYKAELILATHLSATELDDYYGGAGIPAAPGTRDRASRVHVYVYDALLPDGRMRVSIAAISSGDCARW